MIMGSSLKLEKIRKENIGLTQDQDTSPSIRVILNIQCLLSFFFNLTLTNQSCTCCPYHLSVLHLVTQVIGADSMGALGLDRPKTLTSTHVCQHTVWAKCKLKLHG